MRELLAAPEVELATSRLTRLECRTKPMRESNTALLAQYDRLLSARRLSLHEVTAHVIERATELRARYGFKTPDALHLATALEAGASSFVTGDANLGRCTDLAVEVLTIPAAP